MGIVRPRQVKKLRNKFKNTSQVYDNYLTFLKPKKLPRTYIYLCCPHQRAACAQIWPYLINP
jgi:hypothetical protein